MFGFFRMNPRYQPAETKHHFNIQHVTKNITLYIWLGGEIQHAIHLIRIRRI